MDIIGYWIGSTASILYTRSTYEQLFHTIYFEVLQVYISLCRTKNLGRVETPIVECQWPYHLNPSSFRPRSN